MAIFRPSILVPSISGKIGGTTFQTGGKSPIIRRKTTPRPRTSAAAMAHRVKYQHLTHAWRALTDGDRAAWNALAFSITFKNRVGVPRTPTGRELYFREQLIQGNTGVPYGPIPTATTMTPQPYALAFPLWQPEALIISWTQPTSPAQAYSAIYAGRSGRLHQTKAPTNLPYVEQTAAVPGGNITIPVILGQGTPNVGEYIHCAVRVRATNHLWSAATLASAPTTAP